MKFFPVVLCGVGGMLGAALGCPAISWGQLAILVLVLVSYFCGRIDK